jgi:hypothetical protein
MLQFWEPLLCAEHRIKQTFNVQDRTVDWQDGAVRATFAKEYRQPALWKTDQVQILYNQNIRQELYEVTYIFPCVRLRISSSVGNRSGLTAGICQLIQPVIVK